MIKKRAAMQHFQLGKDLYLRQLYQGAIREYHKALALCPEWQEARQALVWARRDFKLSQQLESKRRVSLPQVVNSAQQYFQRGQRLERENNLVEAALAYKSALQILSNYPEAQQALARVQSKAQTSLFMNGKDYRDKRLAESAEMDRLQARRLKNSTAPISHSAMVQTKTASPAAPAQATGETSISQAVQNHFLNGNQALDNGEWSVAIQEFELVLEFVPDHKKAAYKLAIAKGKQADELRMAQQRAQEAESSGDKIRQIKAMRDLAAIAPSDPKLAQAWEQTRKQNQDQVEQLYRKGVEFYAAGNYEEALQNWELVLDLNPEHKKSLESIKKVREKLLLISSEEKTGQ
jgi:tetratricopeptide (TPR) repeat protein